MKKFYALFCKDFSQLRDSGLSALFFGIPIFFLFSMAADFFDRPMNYESLSFWVVFFIGQTSLLYRSFSLEQRFQCFHVYSAWGVPNSSIFWSQTLCNWLGGILLGLFYLLLANLFGKTPLSFNLDFLICLLAVSLAMAPLGTLLSLLLQVEREFLFGLFFLPASIPVFLAALSITEGQNPSTWMYILFIFILISGGLSSFLFEFFFDELTQSH